MITPCARHMGERTTAALAPGAIPARMPRSPEPPLGENSLARIWHGYLIFAAFRLFAAAGQTGCSRILAGHQGVLRLAAGLFLRPRRLRRRCSAPLPRVAGPGFVHRV